MNTVRICYGEQGGIEICNDYPTGTGGGAFSSELNNCTLIGNNANQRGGGADNCRVNVTTLLANSADNFGGAVYHGELNNCLVISNSAPSGGGVFSATLNNCTVVGNSASYADGGALMSQMNNCIVACNSAPADSNFGGDSFVPIVLNYCCTSPLPTNGVGNFTNAPLFVDPDNGDFHLQSNSPCINAGNNAYPPSVDLDGNPRIVGGTVDMGAYEFQSPQSLLSYAWLEQYGLPTDGSADFTDPDGDGHNNWQEWRAWTDPTDAASALRLLSPTPATNGVVVRWQSVSGQTYFLERATHLDAQTAFIPLASYIPGQLDTTVFTDTNAVGPGPFFYRIGVRE